MSRNVEQEVVMGARTFRKGFTLVEIMIVILIIGVLLAIAIPNFLKSRSTSRRSAIIANLREIDMAKDQYAMEHGLGPAAPVTGANLFPTYLKSTWPDGTPTADATYVLTTVQANTTCATEGFTGDVNYWTTFGGSL